jgi:hypothetical protein
MKSEEDIKQKISKKYFSQFEISLGKIDFTVSLNDTNLLWAEAKPSPTDIHKMFAQLFLTVKPELNKLGIHRHPPKYLGCFDSEKIAFVENFNAQIIFGLNDFNWNETPSNPSEKTIATVKNYLENITVFYFNSDEINLKNFIKNNFTVSEQTVFHYRQIDKNNFIQVYHHWKEAVQPHIQADWKAIKEGYSLYDRDFFLADLNIDDNNTVDISDDKIVHKSFHIVFENEKYRIKLKEKGGLLPELPVPFRKNNLEPYINFWKHYKRPPKEEYWNYIIDRQDLLTSQDVRERKGTFYTPQAWVELSQAYLADVFGIDWQDEYYIWDCAAGSGNLLNGLVDKYRIFASDIDLQNINVMNERIRNGANLLKQNVFQFDFLNDSFSELPKKLQDIIKNEPQKLIVYINPPYGECGFEREAGKGNKSGISNTNKIHERYIEKIGRAGRELFSHFFLRIYCEIPNCKIAAFSKMKYINSPNFSKFREIFKAEYKNGFICIGSSFDNVVGNFPIGFLIWDLAIKNEIEKVTVDVYTVEK